MSPAGKKRSRVEYGLPIFQAGLVFVVDGVVRWWSTGRTFCAGRLGSLPRSLRIRVPGAHCRVVTYGADRSTCSTTRCTTGTAQNRLQDEGGETESIQIEGDSPCSALHQTCHGASAIQKIAILAVTLIPDAQPVFHFRPWQSFPSPRFAIALQGTGAMSSFAVPKIAGNVLTSLPDTTSI